MLKYNVAYAQNKLYNITHTVWRIEYILKNKHEILILIILLVRMPTLATLNTFSFQTV